MGGTDDPSNLVLVTIEDHANLHKQLWEDFGCWQDEIAWKALSGQITMNDAQKQAIRQGQLNSAAKNKGRKWSEQEKQKLRKPKTNPSSLKGRKLGPRPQHIKDKIRNTLLGKKHSQERIESNRKGQIKRFSDIEEREKIKEQLKIARNAKSKRNSTLL